MTDFTITIHERTAHEQGAESGSPATAPYTVTASYQDATATGHLHADSTDPQWSSALRTLESSMYRPDAAAIMEIGGQLYRALFHGSVRDLWIAARADLEQGRAEGLRLRLEPQPAAVAALPWEALYDPDRNMPFAASTYIALVRVATNYRHLGPARRLRVSLPLRVLIAAPEDKDGVVSSKREIEMTRQVLAALGAETIQVETFTDRFTISDLRQKLAAFKPAILHFIGHGTPDGLWLWQHNKPHLVTSASWRATLERATSIKLALLNTCLAGQTAGAHAFAGVSTQLLQAGLPGVIAMQTPIRDDAAIDFAHFLYEELICGPCPGIIDLALSAARNGLYAVNPGDFTYGAPVLWLNNEDGCIFTLDAPTQETAPPALPPKPRPIDLPAEFKWLAMIRNTVKVDTLPTAYRFLRSKWRNLMEELSSVLAQLQALINRSTKHAPDSDDSEDSQEARSRLIDAKVAEYRRYKAAALRLKRLIDEANGS